MSATNPVEPKVVAAVTGAGGGAAIATFAEYVIGVTVYHADATANAGATAVAAVPSPVVGALSIVLAALGAFVFGYSAPKAQSGAGAPIIVNTITPAEGDAPAVGLDGDVLDPGNVGDSPDDDQADHPQVSPA